MENSERAGYNNLSMNEYQRQTYVWNYLDGTQRGGQVYDKPKLPSPITESFHSEPIDDQTLQLKLPSAYNSSRLHASRTTPGLTWGSSSYPRYGIPYCEPNRASSENVSPSCMFSGPRVIYQHYVNQARSQVQWMHDLNQAMNVVRLQTAKTIVQGSPESIRANERRMSRKALHDNFQTYDVIDEMEGTNYIIVDGNPYVCCSYQTMPFCYCHSKDPTMRSRPSFTSHQTRELEQEFSTCQYISRRRRIEIAYSLNLTEKQIKTWFQNRRVKERKTRKPSDQRT